MRDSVNLSPKVVRALPDSEGEHIYRKALRHFVPDGEPRWWWEHFASSTIVEFQAGGGWQHIPKFVPDSGERVWFIVEDDSLPFYPVYETTPSAISEIIPECYGFEYYIVQREFQWLLCETHHNSVIGVGSAVEEKLRAFARC